MSIRHIGVASTVLLLAGLAALLGTSTASAATVTSGFTLRSLTAVVNGNTVTASAAWTASTAGTVPTIGVCARSSSGANFDVGFASNVPIGPSQLARVAATRTLPNDFYTYFGCVNAGGVWTNFGSAALVTPDTTPGQQAAASPPPPSAAAPAGAPGTWTTAFDDEFDGTTLDRTKWGCALNWQLNGVTTSCSNVAVHDGQAWLTMPSTTSGAAIASGSQDGAGANAFTLKQGQFAEARIWFPGDASGNIYNWPAWWGTSRPLWPQGGEGDIAEGLGSNSANGKLTISYHYGPNGVDQGEGFGAPAGAWANSFHTYGIFRATDHYDVYWDGVKVASWANLDNGTPWELLANVGDGPYGGQVVAGSASTVRVDYVRAWTAN